MSHTKEQIKALADQFICHPVSRSIDEIEMAGGLLVELMHQRDSLLSALKWIDTFAFDAPELRERARIAIDSVKESNAC